MKLANINLLHLSLREAFLDILPYYILSSMGMLLVNLFDMSFHKNPIINVMLYISNTFSYIFPLLLLVSISYHLSKNYHVHNLSLGILSFLIFCTVATHITDGEFKFKENITFYAFIIPIASLYSLLLINKIKFLKIIKEDIVSDHLRSVINSLFPMLLIYISFAIVLPHITDFVVGFSIGYLSSHFQSFSLETKAIIQLMVTELTWWLTGVHGNLIYNIFVDTSSYIQTEIFKNITLEEFLFNFVFMGGVGSTLSLILAIVLSSKNQEHRQIAYIALPFGFFNINEILLFGLPVIMNLKLLVPFLLVPVFNFASSYIFFSFVQISHTTQSMSWITPSIVSGYFLGNMQDYSFAFLQVFNLIIGTCIYFPFMKSYDKTQSFYDDLQTIKNKYGFIQELENSKESNYLQSQSDIIAKKKNAQKILSELANGDLLLYYQPKINIKTEECEGVEALLRFQNEKNEILGPYFIPDMEQLGYSHIIDLWVVNKIKDDLEIWAKDNFYPKVGINLSPETISNQYLVNQIIEKLESKNIEIEILERTFAKDINLFMNNILTLKSHGFKISLDDFGAGFSSLHYLHNLPVDTIKIDKVLLDNAKTKEGKILYENIVKMCIELNYKIISEGVEDEEALNFIKNINIDTAQGFYYSKAICFEKVKSYYNKK